MAVIEVRKLHKRYGDRVAVRDVSFTVERGEIFGIVGRNGAGKTTTVECVEGLRRPDGGNIRVLDLDPRDPDVRDVLGAQLQQSRLPDRLKVREALRLFASFYRHPADPDELMERLGLAGQAAQPYKKLSGGQQQRLSIGLALVGNPQIAVLDELTTGLDPQARRDTWQLIEDVRAGGITILLVTHFMDEAERLCDRVAVIDAGSVVALDTPAGLVARVADGQRVRFRTSRPLRHEVLRGVGEVTERDGLWQVTGTGNLVHAVTSALAAADVVPLDLRVDQAGLDEAFVALTGSPIAAVPVKES